MDIVLDLREFSRSHLITMIWIIASAGPSRRIGNEIGRRRLPDAEALEKLARLAVIYGGGASSGSLSTSAAVDNSNIRMALI